MHLKSRCHQKNRFSPKWTKFSKNPSCKNQRCKNMLATRKSPQTSFISKVPHNTNITIRSDLDHTVFDNPTLTRVSRVTRIQLELLFLLRHTPIGNCDAMPAIIHSVAVCDQPSFGKVYPMVSIWTIYESTVANVNFLARCESVHFVIKTHLAAVVVRSDGFIFSDWSGCPRDWNTVAVVVVFYFGTRASIVG